MSETNIGYAVLQVIPSLKGVSEAIEKQLGGKVIAVQIEPKTDAAKVDKSVKDAVKKKPVEVPVTPKVDQKKLDEEIEATKKKILKGAKDWDEFNKRTAEKWAKEQAEKAKAAAEAQGKESGKILADATAKAIKNAPGAVEAGKKIGKDLSENASAAIGEGFGTRLKDALSGLEIGKTLRDEITNALKTDPAGAIGGVANALQAIGQTRAADTIRDFGTKVSAIQTDTANLKTSLEGTTTSLMALTNSSGKISGGLSSIAGAAGPLAIAFEGLKMMPGWMDAMNKVQTGNAGWKDWLEVLVPTLTTIQKIETSVLSIVNAGRLPMPTLDTSPRALLLPKDPRQPDAVVDQFGRPVPVAPPGGVHNPTPAPPGRDTNPMPTGPPSLGALAPTDRPHAVGGMISGPGTGVSDSILARVSNGEYIVNANATRKNLPLLEVINSGKLPGFETGGLVAGSAQLRKIIAERFGISNIGGYRPGGDGFNEHSTGRALDVMVGNDKAKGDAVKDFALANASAIDLKWAIWRQHLYYPGGGGYDMPDRGSPTQNHMDHVHIFSGPGIVNGLLGALQGQVPSPAAVKGPGDTATNPAGLMGGVGEAASTAGGPAAASPAGFSMPSIPSSPFGDLAGFGLSGLGKGVGATKSGSDLSLFGNAAASAVGGQVDSALSSFGVPGAPHWLGAISKFVSGISIGGVGGGGSAAAAIPTAAAAAIPSPAGMPDSVKTVGGMQQPGNQTIFNIQTARTEDAFVLAQRREREKAAAKLGRWT